MTNQTSRSFGSPGLRRFIRLLIAVPQGYRSLCYCVLADNGFSTILIASPWSGGFGQFQLLQAFLRYGNSHVCLGLFMHFASSGRWYSLNLWLAFAWKIPLCSLVAFGLLLGFFPCRKCPGSGGVLFYFFEEIIWSFLVWDYSIGSRQSFFSKSSMGRFTKCTFGFIRVPLSATLWRRVPMNGFIQQICWRFIQEAIPEDFAGQINRMFIKQVEIWTFYFFFCSNVSVL